MLYNRYSVTVASSMVRRDTSVKVRMRYSAVGPFLSANSILTTRHPLRQVVDLGFTVEKYGEGARRETRQEQIKTPVVMLTQQGVRTATQILPLPSQVLPK